MYGGNFSTVAGFLFLGGNDFGGGGKTKIWRKKVPDGGTFVGGITGGGTFAAVMTYGGRRFFVFSW